MCIQTSTPITLRTRPSTIDYCQNGMNMLRPKQSRLACLGGLANGSSKSDVMYNLPSCCDQRVCAEQGLQTSNSQLECMNRRFSNGEGACSCGRGGTLTPAAVQGQRGWVDIRCVRFLRAAGQSAVLLQPICALLRNCPDCQQPIVLFR